MTTTKNQALACEALATHFLQTRGTTAKQKQAAELLLQARDLLAPEAETPMLAGSEAHQLHDVIVAYVENLGQEPKPEVLNLKDADLNRDDARSFTDWFVTRAITNHAPKDPELKKAWDALRIESIPVSFKIAGISVPFEKVLYGINEQLDELVERKAFEVFTDRCKDLMSELEEFKDNLRTRGRELFPSARTED